MAQGFSQLLANFLIRHAGAYPLKRAVIQDDVLAHAHGFVVVFPHDVQLFGVGVPLAFRHQRNAPVERIEEFPGEFLRGFLEDAPGFVYGNHSFTIT
jgi:hypothetical protein